MKIESTEAFQISTEMKIESTEAFQISTEVKMGRTEAFQISAEVKIGSTEAFQISAEVKMESTQAKMSDPTSPSLQPRNTYKPFKSAKPFYAQPTSTFVKPCL